MKKCLLLMGTCIVVIMGCGKTTDVPSLDEQKAGKWRIQSYTEERYNVTSNTVNKTVVTCGPNDYMDFSNDKVVVNFDSAGAENWPSAIVDHNTLLLQSRKWDIEKLDASDFRLVLIERDTALKQREVVRYELIRP